MWCPTNLNETLRCDYPSFGTKRKKKSRRVTSLPRSLPTRPSKASPKSPVESRPLGARLFVAPYPYGPFNPLYTSCFLVLLRTSQEFLSSCPSRVSVCYLVHLTRECTNSFLCLSPNPSYRHPKSPRKGIHKEVRRVEDERGRSH